MVGIDFHKGGVSLDEGGILGFGIAGEGGRTRKEEKRGRRKKKNGCRQFLFKLNIKVKKIKFHVISLIPLM